MAKVNQNNNPIDALTKSVADLVDKVGELIGIVKEKNNALPTTTPDLVPVTAPTPGAADDNLLKKLGIGHKEFESDTANFSKSAQKAIDDYNKSLSKLPDDIKRINEYKAYEKSHKSLVELAEYDADKNRWSMNDGADKTKFAKAEKEYNAAKANLQKKVNGSDVSSHMKDYQKSYRESAKYRGVFGKVNAMGLAETAKDNLDIFSETAREGRGLEKTARYVGLGASLYLAGRAVFKSRDEEGNERPVSSRLMELAGALGVAGLSVATGRVR